MAGFRSVKRFAEAEAEGRSLVTHYRKNFTTSVGSQFWQDTSLVAGGPPANFYAATPLEAATLNGTRGIYHGDNKSPSAKYLTHWGAMVSSANLNGPLHLLDYLLFYPFVDSDDLATQTMTTDTTLPRYTSGEGVMVMPVGQSTTAGGGTFTFVYTNQDGVEKTSPTNLCNSAGNLTYPGNVTKGTVAGGANSGWPFCELAAGDRGVRDIKSVTYLTTNGGLVAFVLVKVLATNVLREASTMSEVEFVTNLTPPPRIYDGAYLNILMYHPGNTTGSTLTGYIRTIWDEGT